MTEDFIIEEEHEDASNNRRPFLVAVGILLSIFILAAICSTTLLLTRGNKPTNGDAAAIAAIEATNEAVAVINAAVTQTIIARETEKARPSDTPVPPPTNTPIPTNTLRPTDTPVVGQAGEGEETATPNLSGTSTFSNGAANNTPTPISSLSGSNGGNDSLPQTGIETWGALIAGLGLIAVLFLARRLRSS